MDWFENKRQYRVSVINKALETPKTSVGILDGNEDESTPVEPADLGKLARLHPFSPVAISLLHQFDREDATVHEIAKLVQSDAALAAETLAYVNSPLFARRESVTDLQNAIVLIGADNTKRLAATLAMRSMLKSAPKPGVSRRLWRHSIATAVIATELAPLYNVPPDLANTAGVLHDLGRMGLLALDCEAYGRVVVDLHENVDAILLAERQVCPMDHCAAGAYLCRVWALPDVFEEVAAKHHQAKSQTDIAGLIHVACSMADDLTFAAISHRGTLSMEERVAECVPEGLRERVMARQVGIEERIEEKVKSLDF